MGKEGLGNRISPQAVTVIQYVGYGCYHTLFCGGAFGVANAAHALAGNGVLLSQLILLAATALGCLGYRYLFRKIPVPSSRLLGIVSLATVAIVFILEFTFLPRANAPSIYLLSCVAGLAMSYPLLFWFNQFLGVYQHKGRVRCIIAIAWGTTSCTVVSLAAPLAGDNETAVLALALLALALSGICQLLLTEKAAVHRSDRPATGERYRLTAYSAATLVGFGTTWGLSIAVSLYPYRPDMPPTSAMLSALAAVGHAPLSPQVPSMHAVEKACGSDCSSVFRLQALE